MNIPAWAADHLEDLFTVLGVGQVAFALPPDQLGAQTLVPGRVERGLSPGREKAADGRFVEWRGGAGIAFGYLHALEAAERCPSVLVADALAAALELDDEDRATLMAHAVNDAGRCWRWPGR